MARALTFAAVAESVIGLALLIVPALVGRLLLGAELTGLAVPVARVAGSRPARAPKGSFGSAKRK
jgi:hypothetical protein